MRILTTLSLLALCSFPSEAATWYVSNTPTNGYAAGSDVNDGSTVASPLLTLAQAISRATAGDLINVNPTGVAYEESSGNLGYLLVDRRVTLQTDPSLLGIGKAAIRPSAGGRTPLQLGADGILLQDLVIDANNSPTLSQGVSLTNDIVELTLRRCDFAGFPASARFCVSTSITNGQILLDRCTASRDAGVSSAVRFLSAPEAAPDVAITVQGCTIAGLEAVFQQSGSAAGPFALTCDGAPDGTRNTFSNLSSCITWGACAPGTAVTVNNADLYAIAGKPFGGLGSPDPLLPTLRLQNLVVADTVNDLVSTDAGETIGSLWISNVTHQTDHYLLNNAGAIFQTRITNCSFEGRGPVIYSANADLQDLQVANCRFDSNSTVLYLPQGGNGVTIQDCRFIGCTATAINLSGLLPNILIRSNTLAGAYGLLVVKGILASNIVVEGNSIVLTNATSEPIAVTGSTGVEIFHNRVWSDSPAAVAIMVGSDGYYTSDSISGADASNNLGDTSARAWIAQRWKMPDSSTYCDRAVASFCVSPKIVGSPTGTIQAFLYSDSGAGPADLLATSSVRVNAGALSSTAARPLEFWFDSPYLGSYSATYWLALNYTGPFNGVDYVVLDSNAAGWPVQTAENGANWVPGAGALVYTVYHGNFACVNPLVHDNYVACSTPTARLHCVFLGAVTGGRVYRNQAYGGGPMLVAKLVDGSRVPCLFYDNLVFEWSGTQEGLRDKGSRGVQFLHNTVVMNGTAGMAIVLDNNYSGGSYNGHPSENALVENNIFCADNLPGGNVLYQLGETGFLGPTCVNPTIDYNLVYGAAGLGYYGVDASNGAEAVSYTSWPAWQAAGYDIHGLNADPQLLNPLNPNKPADFTPAQASPAGGAGTNLLEIVPADFYGLSNEAAPQLGAIRPPPPPLLDIASAATALEIGVHGVPGQRLILQGSFDSLNWVSLATNVLSIDRWVYTNSSPLAPAAQSFRALDCRLCDNSAPAPAN